MIKIILSERDFDYEIAALVTSFFPGQKNKVVVENENMSDDMAEMKIKISFMMDKICISISFENYDREDISNVTGDGDWHKNPDKTTHPYRTYYKNVLKKMLFNMLREIPKEKLPVGIVKSVPVWGTMTGVRPTKIPMNQLLSGKSVEKVKWDLKECYCCSDDKIKLSMDIASKEAKLLKKVDYNDGYSLYIGIPFCPTTCLYCSFTSYPYEKFGYLSEQYLSALTKEITEVKEHWKDKKLTSIYVGGGTPTTLSSEYLEKLLSCIREAFPVRESYEFTVEAGRPDSITEEKLMVLRKYGVERISVNPQTMKQETLEYIGRKHTVNDTIEAFKLARKCGFSNINMDLIMGLPGETKEDFVHTLEEIRKLNPDSITCHSLVIKRGSRLRSLLEESGDYLEQEDFRRKQMDLMLEYAIEFCEREGYMPYYMYRQKNTAGHYGNSGQENIGFAKEGKECLYNILIMEEMQTILAVGAGASTKVYDKEKMIVRRVENVKSITEYINRIDEMIERKRDGIWRRGD